MRACVKILPIVVAICFAAGCSRPKQPPKPAPAFEPDPSAVGKPASGRAAIVVPANGQITEAQVRDYVTSHRLPHADATNMTIVSASFLTHQQVRTILHSANLGLPDDAPLCLVVMSGKFAFSGPPGANPTFPYADEVFDARTGNLLQAGGLPSARQLPPVGAAP